MEGIAPIIRADDDCCRRCYDSDPQSYPTKADAAIGCAHRSRATRIGRGAAIRCRGVIRHSVGCILVARSTGGARILVCSAVIATFTGIAVALGAVAMIIILIVNKCIRYCVQWANNGYQQNTDKRYTSFHALTSGLMSMCNFD
jgi:hypothetical protein